MDQCARMDQPARMDQCARMYQYARMRPSRLSLTPHMDNMPAWISVHACMAQWQLVHPIVTISPPNCDSKPPNCNSKPHEHCHMNIIILTSLSLDEADVDVISTYQIK